MKLSDYVFQFLASRGAGHVFMLPGGGAMHLVDSLGRSGLECLCCLHEQAAAIAAEAWGQHTNRPGLCLTTSGPGATNAITGVTAGWIDSTPMVILSGQAKRSDLIGDTGVRQIGSQEVQIIDMVRPITKYAVQVMEPGEIRYHLERAWHEATSGRPGPVWLSIPLDVQAAEIDPEAQEGFAPPRREEPPLDEALERTISLLAEAQKPLILAGNGIKLANAEEAFLGLVDLLGVPVQTTWKVIDMMGEDNPFYLGHPGAMGDRGANLALQEADLLLTLGTRLDTSLTAFNEPHFGRFAKKVIVDIDPNELRRMRLRDVEVRLACDVGRFIEGLRARLSGDDRWRRNRGAWADWLASGRALRARYPVVTEAHRNKRDFVSAYYFTELLCRYSRADDVIVPESSGAAGEILYQAFRLKRGQRMKNAAGLGSMGFGLPYALGACLANGGRRTLLVNGDGAFQLNIQELETVARLNLPIKIFIWSNGGYASIRNMQNNTFGGHHVASGRDSGLTLPDLCRVAAAYGLETLRIHNNSELERELPRVLADDRLMLCELCTAEDEGVSPRTKTFRRPDGTLVSSELENMWPEVER